jgi:HEAT repeat protein
MTNDPNPDIVAGALTTLGVLHAPGAIARLTAALDRPSFHETISSGALTGLAADCNERALAAIKARTAYGTPEIERDAAVEALAQCALQLKKPQLALGELVDLATHDPLIRTRLAAVDALGALGDKAAIPVLERVAHGDSQETVREVAQSALLSLQVQNA